MTLEQRILDLRRKGYSYREIAHLCRLLWRDWALPQPPETSEASVGAVCRAGLSAEERQELFRQQKAREASQRPAPAPQPEPTPEVDPVPERRPDRHHDPVSGRFTADHRVDVPPTTTRPAGGYLVDPEHAPPRPPPPAPRPLVATADSYASWRARMMGFRPPTSFANAIAAFLGDLTGR